MSLEVPVDVSDLRKLKRVLEMAEHYHRATDEANASRHCAINEAVIHSPRDCRKAAPYPPASVPHA